MLENHLQRQYGPISRLSQSTLTLNVRSRYVSQSLLLFAPGHRGGWKPVYPAFLCHMASARQHPDAARLRRAKIASDGYPWRVTIITPLQRASVHC